MVPTRRKILTRFPRETRQYSFPDPPFVGETDNRTSSQVDKRRGIGYSESEPQPNASQVRYPTGQVGELRDVSETPSHS